MRQRCGLRPPAGGLVILAIHPIRHESLHMATEPGFLEHIVELAGLGARLSYKKMFGEYALYVDGRVVAFACDNSLFVKPSAAAVALAPELPQGPPYPQA